MEDHWVDVVNELEAKVKELEGKLKIATENCAQAVKERDEAMHVAGVACQDLADTECELETLGTRLAAAEAVCLYLMGWLLMEPNSRIKELLNQWIEIRDQQELKEKP
mgnify:CR=1 FL=1